MKKVFIPYSKMMLKLKLLYVQFRLVNDRKVLT